MSSLGGIDWSAGYNLEAAIGAGLGLWLLLTGAKSERAETEAAREADPGTPEYEEKLRRLRKRYPDHLWLGRLAGAALFVFCGFYLARQRGLLPGGAAFLDDVIAVVKELLPFAVMGALVVIVVTGGAWAWRRFGARLSAREPEPEREAPRDLSGYSRRETTLAGLRLVAIVMVGYVLFGAVLRMLFRELGMTWIIAGFALCIGAAGLYLLRKSRAPGTDPWDAEELRPQAHLALLGAGTILALCVGYWLFGLPG